MGSDSELKCRLQPGVNPAEILSSHCQPRILKENNQPWRLPRPLATPLDRSKAGCGSLRRSVSWAGCWSVRTTRCGGSWCCSSVWQSLQPDRSNKIFFFSLSVPYLECHIPREILDKALSLCDLVQHILSELYIYRPVTNNLPRDHSANRIPARSIVDMMVLRFCLTWFCKPVWDTTGTAVFILFKTRIRNIVYIHNSCI